MILYDLRPSLCKLLELEQQILDSDFAFFFFLFSFCFFPSKTVCIICYGEYLAKWSVILDCGKSFWIFKHVEACEATASLYFLVLANTNGNNPRKPKSVDEDPLAHTIVVSSLFRNDIVLTPFCNETEWEEKVKSLSRAEALKEGEVEEETTATSVAAKTLCIPLDQVTFMEARVRTYVLAFAYMGSKASSDNVRASRTFNEDVVTRPAVSRQACLYMISSV